MEFCELIINKTDPNIFFNIVFSDEAIFELNDYVCNGPSFSVLDAERDCRKGSSDAGFGRAETRDQNYWVYK